jgi:multiple sugar transport system substrate-binding protein
MDQPAQPRSTHTDRLNPNCLSTLDTFRDALTAAVNGTKLGFISANSNADTSSYNELQKKSAALVSSAKSLAQFLDRDTRPDFASTVVIPAFQSFIKDPNDIDGLTKSLEEQKKSIFI